MMALGRRQTGKAPAFGAGIWRFESSRPSQHVAPHCGGTCACGAPAIGSAGCGLDRSPGPVLALRSRGVSLLPRSDRETTHAASYWMRVGEQALASEFDSGIGDFSEASVITLAAREVS